MFKNSYLKKKDLTIKNVFCNAALTKKRLMMDSIENGDTSSRRS